jgi:hypothetical protein
LMASSGLANWANAGKAANAAEMINKALLNDMVLP